jgi:hypothetical protein
VRRGRGKANTHALLLPMAVIRGMPTPTTLLASKGVSTVNLEMIFGQAIVTSPISFSFEKLQVQSALRTS